jgi:uncharacterized membrane protein
MKTTLAAEAVCQICQQRQPRQELIPADMVSPPVAQCIIADHPTWSADGFICHADLDHYRTQLVRAEMVQSKGELSALEEEVLNSVKEEELLAKNINAEYDSQLTFGEHVADNIATFGGSWKFIFTFLGILFVWLLLNSIQLIWRHPFDPFPFILLNLVLSCIAAIQAPVIMMSQNRQEEKDRMRAEHDYQVNLKAELEIRNLHAKMDELLTHQWQRLLEIQQVQLEMMEELAQKVAVKESVNE